MDFQSLKDQVSNLTLYDIKAGVRKVQNAVMNFTEMEAKVREATNNDPWGAPSTLMMEIAQGTYNYQLLNEIMPMIYKRFTEKSAEEWRQIYKGLVLLEFLIKNGSERVIDDARSHLTLLKMLRQFHFIDLNGKDQGVNVRNRAKELAELLSDVERIRSERKKARANKNKYGGVEGGGGLGMSSGSGARYGGFGSEDAGSGGGGGGGAGYGAYSGGVYGDGGGFGGQSSDFQDTGRDSGRDTGSRAERFEEYDEYDEGTGSSHGRRHTEASTSSRSSRRAGTEKSTSRKVEAPPKKKAPEVDLFSFDDPIPASSSSMPAINTAAEDDDFDDFQSATPVPPPTSAPSFGGIPPPTTSTTTSQTQYASPQPVSAPKAANLSELVGFSSISPAQSNTSTPANYSAFSPPPIIPQIPRQTSYQSTQPNYYTSVQVPVTQTASSTPSYTPAASRAPATKSSSSSGGDAFGSLWSTASTGIKKTSTPSSGPALGQLAKEKTSAGIWGTAASSTPSQSQTQQRSSTTSQQKVGGGLEDLLG